MKVDVALSEQRNREMFFALISQHLKGLFFA
jgi:hypothetical protein